MVQSTKIQAACLLLLLIASLTNSSTLLQQLARQPGALQPGHRTEARADMSFLIPNRKKRDTNLPVCLFCCGCCKNGSCGFCCKT
ncbi:hepcidin [Onychomys torridus]|uniref:hepcidin n=1 Tax=Onychomys torridus TaxID=38674 RepID=UPI00167F6164|nr:hepcidin [Onychomys torridus]